MENPKNNQRELPVNCPLCETVFNIFKTTLYIYFFWFILAVLLSKTNSFGQFVAEILHFVEHYNFANLLVAHRP